MAADTAQDSCPYDATVMVSPARLGGEKKDQDRAVWFEQGMAAVVCDGVTSSPCAGEAMTEIFR